jgi:hypothetical protein
VRAHTTRAGLAPRGIIRRVPRTWIYSMGVLIACLIASMVIAIVKLT